MLPHGLPPWQIVHQQAQRWIQAGYFEAMVHDLRELLRVIAGRDATPRTAIIDSRTLQSTFERGAQSAYDGVKRRKRSKVHIAVDTLGQLFSLKVSAANEQDRVQVGELSDAVQEADLCRSGLRRRVARPSGSSAQHRPDCGETVRSQTGLCHSCRGAGLWNVPSAGSRPWRWMSARR